MNLSLPQKVLAGILLAICLFQVANYLQPPTVIAINSQIPGLVKINYLAPKVVLAQAAADNKLLKLSCPWAEGPKFLGNQSGGSPPILTVANAVGSCVAPTCQSIGRTLVASYCVPTGVDIPFSVVDTQTSTILPPPSPPAIHYVSGGNATDYYHQIGGPNASPYIPGGTTPGGGGGQNAGGNGSGGTSIPGAACARHSESPGPGQSGPTVTWCGGSCPVGQGCWQTGYAEPNACECRPIVPNGNGKDYPLVGNLGVGGPVNAGKYTPGTSTGEPGAGTTAGSDTGAGGFDPEQNPNTLSLAGPGTPGYYSGGLFTPATWWFATVGVCVNVCK